MANTRKFNTTVKLGSKTYAPGEDVPISKNGLSEADADNLDQIFGKWRAAEGDAVDKRFTALTEERDTLADQVTALKAEAKPLADLKAERDNLAEQVRALTSERDELTKERDQALEDNATLSEALKALQDEEKGDDAATKDGSKA
ncbi:hypothetical protein [Martelella mediterranea]|uniref:Uncharacterized protein n=1 Tax=Martelella mediterranea TaxID=293089 RepID=A0A4R3NIA0_9HYPH|nr:hypothetical protein [Martelella mediterranea]TCT34703.1 hypothetical protein EDC90_103244 [Martelella mediterranea]